MVREHSAEILQSPASQRLREFLQGRRQAWQHGTPEFEQFERELHEHVMNLERECLAEELARYDVTAERIEVAGMSYQPVLRAAETYLSAAGPVRIERQLYRPAGRNAKSVSKNNFLFMNKGDSLATWTGERESFERSMGHWRRI